MLTATERTDFLIPLPSKLLLTPDGVYAFQHSRVQLLRLRNIDGSIREGLVSPKFNAPTVQKLVYNNYLEEIYVELPELLRYRSHIIDTTKLVTFGILYKKLNPTMAVQLIHSPIIQQFNRKNPKSQITSLHHIDGQKMEALRKQREEEFRFIELELRNEVVQRIVSDSNIEEEDRLLRMRSLDKFIAMIDKRIWHLYYIVYQTPLRERILAAFADLLNTYLDRTKIATHLAMMVMEIIQNAEKAHFERLLIHGGYCKSKNEVDTFLRDPKKRKMAVELAMSQKLFLKVAWRFESQTGAGKKPYKIEIVVVNHGSITDDLQAKLTQKVHTDVEGLSLSDFFEESHEEGKLGAGLGLLYLSYLKKECKENNLQFRTQIIPDTLKGTTNFKVMIVF